MFANSTRKTRVFIIIALLCLAYGVLMEFVQKYFIPNRSCDINDMLADAAGALLGLLIALRVYKKNRPL
jgi:VanZ family protein